MHVMHVMKILSEMIYSFLHHLWLGSTPASEHSELSCALHDQL